MLRTLIILVALMIPAHSAEFKITVDDEDVLAGITWARTQYNASIPAQVCTRNKPNDAVDTSETCVANPDLIATDDDYVQRRILSALESYAKQKVTSEGAAKVRSDEAALDAKIRSGRVGK